MEVGRPSVSVAEFRHWQLLQKYAAILSHRKVFRLITEGTLSSLDEFWGRVDMYLPIDAPETHAAHYSLDVSTGKLVVDVFGSDHVARITDPLLRQQQLRQAIRVLKEGTELYYQNSMDMDLDHEGVGNPNYLDWKSNFECSCGSAWEEHGPNLACPIRAVA